MQFLVDEIGIYFFTYIAFRHAERELIGINDSNKLRISIGRKPFMHNMKWSFIASGDGSLDNLSDSRLKIPSLSKKF